MYESRVANDDKSVTKQCAYGLRPVLRRGVLCSCEWEGGEMVWFETDEIPRRNETLYQKGVRCKFYNSPGDATSCAIAQYLGGTLSQNDHMSECPPMGNLQDENMSARPHRKNNRQGNGST